MLGHEYYNSRGELHNFETPKQPMGKEQVEIAMEPTHAAIILQKNPYVYAETRPYSGGDLSAERTGLKADNKYILAIKEDNYVIGYTLRSADEVITFLKSSYNGDKAA